MNREIKFRAFWNNEMQYDVHLGTFDGSNIFEILKDKRYPEDYVKLMQYTGLKDKNGKEIYEGDIVKRMKVCYDWDKEDGEERYEVEQISFIEYRGNGFWVNSEDFGYEGEDLWDWDKMEIIGNIYENHELL